MLTRAKSIAFLRAPFQSGISRALPDHDFFLPAPELGCPAAVSFWLGAAAMILAFSFFGFFDSRLLFDTGISS
jgi:hypothetical protein